MLQDLMKDALSCGACDAVCPNGEVCKAGQCECPKPLKDLGLCGDGPVVPPVNIVVTAPPQPICEDDTAAYVNVTFTIEADEGAAINVPGTITASDGRNCTYQGLTECKF
jgi:hypothetical protein